MKDVRAGCPKAMQFGPCGGVRADGNCEVDSRRCPFIRADDTGDTWVSGSWRSLPPERSPIRASRRATPMILVDVRAPASWHGDVRRLWESTAVVLAGGDALLGEHVDNPRSDDDSGALSPIQVIELLAAADVSTIATITGRDRTVAEATNIIAAYRRAGAAAIHCVTGDHPRALSLDRDASFELESITLAALASAGRSPATVGESPASPGDRVARLLAKQQAGATTCILNHAGDPGDLIGFARACRAADITLDFIAPVPMIGDAQSASALARFPGLKLPTGYLESIVTAPDPYRRSLDNAIELTAELAASELFVGINLSGSARNATPAQRLASTVEFVDATRQAWIRRSNNPPRPSSTLTQSSPPRRPITPSDEQ